MPNLTRAIAAAMSVAASLDLRADDAVVLHNSNRLALRLTPCDVLARVAPEGHESAQLEVDLAGRLAEAGCPVGLLEPRVEPLVYRRDGFTVTLWVYYEPAGPHVSPVDYAKTLERLHAGMREIDVPSPRFTDRVAEAEAVVADPGISPNLTDTDRVFLGSRLRSLRQTIEARGAEEHLLHGEPHPGNVLSTTHGPLIIDLETYCRGPVEFDLAHVPEAVCEHYPNVDQGLLDECRELVLAMCAAWRWDVGDELPNGRRFGEEFLRVLRAGPPWPTLDAVIRRLDGTDARDPEILRYAAFTLDPSGGNPAGVVLDASALDDAAMQRIAAEVGYSETVFLRAPEHDQDQGLDQQSESGAKAGAKAGARAGARAFEARYFSPLAEVPFCGHATIAGAVALAEQDGPGLLSFATKAGQVQVETGLDSDGEVSATLTSVATRIAEPEPAVVAEALALLRWSEGDLDPALPVRVAYAGAHHLVLAAATRERLADLAYDFDGLAALMRAQDWTTLQLVWRESAHVFHSRNPFPVGGVVEDPATGAAAAALGGYLRELGLVTVPATLRLHQGHDLGRPSLLTVDVPADLPGIRVTGTAVPINAAATPPSRA